MGSLGDGLQSLGRRAVFYQVIDFASNTLVEPYIVPFGWWTRLC